jgi:hypothetical protein
MLFKNRVDGFRKDVDEFLRIVCGIILFPKFVIKGGNAVWEKDIRY